MSELQLVIKKKITAILPDGRRRSTLGVNTATQLLAGEDDISVTLDDNKDPYALKLLRAIAETGGFRIVPVDDGFLLKQAQADEVSAPIEMPATKVRGGMIVLSPQEVFTSCEKALAHVLSWQPTGTLPTKYHQDLTQTFMNGHADGQLHSLFKDLKRYGAPGIMPKLKAFVAFAGRAHTAQYSRYNAFLSHGFMPHHLETQVIPKRVDASFFKYWLFRELVKLAEAEGK